MDFRSWMANVDFNVREITGDWDSQLPAFRYRYWYIDDRSPAETAHAAALTISPA